MSQTQVTTYTSTRDIMPAIQAAFEVFCNEEVESVRSTDKRIGNSAAARRARKASLKVRHLLKQYKALKINE